MLREKFLYLKSLLKPPVNLGYTDSIGILLASLYTLVVVTVVGSTLLEPCQRPPFSSSHLTQRGLPVAGSTPAHCLIYQYRIGCPSLIIFVPSIISAPSANSSTSLLLKFTFRFVSHFNIPIRLAVVIFTSIPRFRTDPTFLC